MDDLQAKNTEVECLTESLSASQTEVAQLRGDLAQKLYEQELQVTKSEDIPIGKETQQAILKVLNKEVCAHTTAKHTRNAATENEQQRIRDLVHATSQYHTSFRVDLNNIRHIVVDFGAPSRVVKELDELATWMNIVMNDLAEQYEELAEEAKESEYSHEEERNDRMSALMELAEVCGVRDRLYTDLPGRKEDDDGSVNNELVKA
jgi:hypothetical protein